MRDIRQLNSPTIDKQLSENSLVRYDILTLASLLSSRAIVRYILLVRYMVAGLEGKFYQTDVYSYRHWAYLMNTLQHLHAGVVFNICSYQLLFKVHFHTCLTFDKTSHQQTAGFKVTPFSRAAIIFKHECAWEQCLWLIVIHCTF